MQCQADAYTFTCNLSLQWGNIVELHQKKALLKELLTRKATELKLSHGPKAGAYIWLARKCGVSLRTVQNWVDPVKGWTQTPEIEEKVWKLLDYRHPDEEETGEVLNEPTGSLSPALQLVPSDTPIKSDTPIRVEVASPLTRITYRLMKAKALRSFMLEIQAEEESIMREVIRDLGLEPPSASPRIEILRKMRQELTKFVNESDPIDIKLTPIVRQKPGEPKKK